MNKIDELEMKIKELSEEIERLKEEKENEVCKPKYGDWYWFISYSGEEKRTIWYGDEGGEIRYELGNVFKTEEEAEFRVGQLKVEAELRRFARPFKNDSENYTFRYWQDEDMLETICFELSQCGNVYFPSEEIAKKAIDTVGEERIKKYYFGVEE